MTIHFLVSNASSSSESECDDNLAGGSDTIVEDSQAPLDLLEIPAAATVATFEDSQDPGAMANDKETQLQLPFNDSNYGEKDPNGSNYGYSKSIYFIHLTRCLSSP